MYERSYHNQVLKKDETTKIKNKKISWKKVLISIFIIGLVVGVFFLIRSPRLQVNKFSIIGASVIDSLDIETNVQKQLEGKHLWFFPRTSILLINKEGIEKQLKKDFSRAETVSVKRLNINTLSIKIKEYDAMYLWCLEKEDDCYFLDSRGVVYNKAPIFSGNAYPKIITGAPLETLPFKAMNDENLAFITSLVKGLSDINIDQVAFRVISKQKMEIDFVHNKDISKIIIDQTLEPSTTLEYLFSAIRAKSFQDLFKDSQRKLLYIDLRFSNKVIYKFQE